MTLNKQKTATLLAYVHQQDDEVTRMNYSAPWISNEGYNNLVDEIATWEIAYNADNLYATAEDNTTYKVEGLDEFPKPPKRS